MRRQLWRLFFAALLGGAILTLPGCNTQRGYGSAQLEMQWPRRAIGPGNAEQPFTFRPTTLGRMESIVITANRNGLHPFILNHPMAPAEPIATA